MYLELYIIFMCIYFSVCKVGIVSHSVVTAHPSPVLSIVRDSCLADWGCWVSFLLMESKHLLCVPFKSTTLLCLPVQLSQSEASRNTPALTKQDFMSCVGYSYGQKWAKIFITSSKLLQIKFLKEKNVVDSSHFQLCHHHPHVEEMFI